MHHFNMREMGSSGKATPVEFNIEHKPFGTGGGFGKRSKLLVVENSQGPHGS